MSLIGLALDVVLMALLVGALLFGMRLNARLKALRAGQEAFAKAVSELDDAAIRAHQSLRELRGNTEETHELLHGRVVAARELIQKLETATARAEKAARSIETGLANQALLQSLSEPSAPSRSTPPPMALSVPARRTEARAPFDRDIVRSEHDVDDEDVPDRVLAGLEQIVRGVITGGAVKDIAPRPAQLPPVTVAASNSAAKPSRRLHAPDEDLF